MNSRSPSRPATALSGQDRQQPGHQVRALGGPTAATVGQQRPQQRQGLPTHDHGHQQNVEGGVAKSPVGAIHDQPEPFGGRHEGQHEARQGIFGQADAFEEAVQPLDLAGPCGGAGQLLGQLVQPDVLALDHGQHQARQQGQGGGGQPPGVQRQLRQHHRMRRAARRMFHRKKHSPRAALPCLRSQICHLLRWATFCKWSPRRTRHSRPPENAPCGCWAVTLGA